MSATTNTIKGRAKEAVCVVTNNQRLKDEGWMDQVTGKIVNQLRRAGFSEK
ncbi:MAG: CsbD family protein [Xanthobacteraceae bacterium]